jgi:hypothetical protein
VWQALLQNELALIPIGDFSAILEVTYELLEKRLSSRKVSIRDLTWGVRMAHQHVMTNYMEHGFCLNWEKSLVFLHVGSVHCNNNILLLNPDRHVLLCL